MPRDHNGIFFTHNLHYNLGYACGLVKESIIFVCQVYCELLLLLPLYSLYLYYNTYINNCILSSVQ